MGGEDCGACLVWERGIVGGWVFGGGGGYGLGWKVGRVCTPAIYLIKTILEADVTINEIFKGGVVDSFVPVMYLIKTGQSTLTIDGSFSSPPIY